MTGPAQPGSHNVAVDAETLRALHVAGQPLLLANIWDPATARVVESAGMRAIATASAALAPVNGYEDHGKLPPDVAFTALRRIAEAVTLPVTADLEDGYGLSPDELVKRVVDAGACGFNLEDTNHAAKVLVDVDQQAERIAAIKAAGRALGVDLVLNARIDVQFHNRPVEEGLHRAKKYFEAGADCVYPILLSDVPAIREYVALGKTNILYRPGGPPLSELVKTGVSRISVGPFLFQLILKRLQAAIDALRHLDDNSIWT
jgi:2-methylisocitrate lyase-like PEP mutase family enzyme